jgi:hypothetical protein
MREQCWGLVRDYPSRKMDTQHRLMAFMEIKAAGLAAQWWYEPPHDMRSPEALLRMFRKRANAPADPNDYDDSTFFVQTGKELDRLKLASNPASNTGPEAWLPIWLAAERQIIHELWPAVRTIADELYNVRRRMRYPRAAELANAAMTWWRAQF